jgi:hypothetical protein
MEFLLYGIILLLALSLLAKFIYRWVPTDSRTYRIAVITVMAICALLAVYRRPAQELPAPTQAATDYEIALLGDVHLDALATSANSRVRGAGAMLAAVGPDAMTRLIERALTNDRFEVKLIMLKPNGRAAIERAQDEGTPRDSLKLMNLLAKKLVEFHNKIKDLPPKIRSNLTIKCIDAYPTIAVLIIDNDLYAWWYRYGSGERDKPVIILKNYETNPRTIKLSRFFLDHLDAVEAKSEAPTEADYQEYERIAVSGHD